MGPAGRLCLVFLTMLLCGGRGSHITKMHKGWNPLDALRYAASRPNLNDSGGTALRI
jgi:hypothetical protein